MDFWNWGGFFKSVKGHVVKWWQQVILPVFQLDNNKQQQVSNNQVGMNTPIDAAATGMQENVQKNYEEPSYESIGLTDIPKEEFVNKSMGNNDAEDILKQFERQKQREEEEKQKAIEKARKKRQEEDRIAAIMNANKVDVNAFIAEGKAIRETEEEKKQQEDNMQRAQEIIDRLNREAMADIEKEKAEIEAAKQMANNKAD